MKHTILSLRGIQGATPFLILFAIGLIWSGICPFDYFTWILEVFPAIVGLGVLAVTYRRFQFTNLTYVMILIHCWILFIGGHYTYAEVPFFDWIKEVFHQSRNNYDKVGHFAQGFVPAFIVRELLIRLKVVNQTSWLAFLTVCTCMAISVAYEFLEWGVAIGSGESADSFLGTQGYVWDTQSDMLYATIGAICMILFFSGIHNKHIHKKNIH
jgi:putative membrane protein